VTNSSTGDGIHFAVTTSVTWTKQGGPKMLATNDVKFRCFRRCRVEVDRVWANTAVVCCWMHTCRCLRFSTYCHAEHPRCINEQPQNHDVWRPR